VVAILDTVFDVYAGDAWTQQFVLKEDESTPMDLSGWDDWSAQWRPAASSDDSLAITLTVDATGAVDGELIISATEAQTRAMGSNGVFDIQAADPVVRTFIRAKTKWRLDVTRA
jgi:hypothetical protein